MATRKLKSTGRTRANNTGSLWNHPKTGRLYCVVTWTDPTTGKRRVERRPVPSNLKSDAWNKIMPALQLEVEEIKRRELQRAGAGAGVGKCRDVNPKTFTLGQLAAYHFEDNLTPPRFNPRTKKKNGGVVSWKDMRRKIGYWLTYFRPNKLVASITVGQVRNYKAARLEMAPVARYKMAGTDEFKTVELDGTITDATVHREIRALSRMLNYAVAEQWLDRNPLVGQKDLVKEKDEEPREIILRTDAEHALIDHCHTHEKRTTLAPYFEVMFGSGCRSSELRRMLVRDVDFDALDDDGNVVGVFNVWTYKGGGDGREVVMTPAARAALVTACAGKGPDDFVFSYDVRQKDADGNDIKNADGTYAMEYRERKYAPRTAVRTLKAEVLEHSKIDLSGVRAHDVRHTVITRLMEEGETAESAGRHVGHKQPSTTWRYYNPNRRSNARIANKLANYTEKKNVVSINSNTRKTA